MAHWTLTNIKGQYYKGNERNLKDLLTTPGVTLTPSARKFLEDLVVPVERKVVQKKGDLTKIVAEIKSDIANKKIIRDRSEAVYRNKEHPEWVVPKDNGHLKDFIQDFRWNVMTILKD